MSSHILMSSIIVQSGGNMARRWRNFSLCFFSLMRIWNGGRVYGFDHLSDFESGRGKRKGWGYYRLLLFKFFFKMEYMANFRGVFTNSLLINYRPRGPMNKKPHMALDTKKKIIWVGSVLHSVCEFTPLHQICVLDQKKNQICVRFI